MSREKQERAGEKQYKAGTSDRILDVAEELAQRRGFNGFSYADIAAELGLTTASLHYHFPSKASLGRELVGRYTNNFMAALAAIEQRESNAQRRLGAYADLYGEVLRRDRSCLCGMLAAEYETLPNEVRDAVAAFFELNEDWLTSVLEDGRADGDLEFSGPATEAAHTLICGLEGAMLIARPYGRKERFSATSARLLESFVPSSR